MALSQHGVVPLSHHGVIPLPVPNDADKKLGRQLFFGVIRVQCWEANRKPWNSFTDSRKLVLIKRVQAKVEQKLSEHPILYPYSAASLDLHNVEGGQRSTLCHAIQHVRRICDVLSVHYFAFSLNFFVYCFVR